MYYQTDLAYVHNQAYSHLAEHAAQVMITQLHLAGIRSGRILDLGCGGGQLAVQLHLAGFTPWGLDYSAEMINLARAQLPTAEWVVGSVFDLPLPPAVAIGAIGEVINYLFDERSSEQDVRALFARFFAALAPGGLLVLDAATPEVLPDSPLPRRHWQEAADDEWLLAVEVGGTDAILTRHIRLFRRLPDGHYRRSEEVHQQRLYTARQLTAWLADAGFSVTLLPAYAALPMLPGRVGLLAHKPA